MALLARSAWFLRARRAFARVALALASTLPLLAAPVAAGATPVSTEHVQAELVAAQTALVPGTTSLVALRLRIAPHWHTYWRNPGETGLPTTLDWKLPAGYRAAPIEWPAPQLLSVGPLKNYGYEGEVLHLVPLSVPAGAQPGQQVTLAARADWLVCRDSCIPEGADLALTLPVAAAASPDPTWSAPIAAARAALPRPLDGWQVSLQGYGATMALGLVPPAGASDPGMLWFFPDDEGRVEPSAPQTLTRDGSGAYVLTLPVASALKPFDRLTGVIRASAGLAAGPPSAATAARVTAATLDVPLTGSVIAGPPASLDVAAAPVPLQGHTVDAGSAGMSLGLAALFAFVGGMILNLMPCVFPVLSLKALSLATAAHDDRRALRVGGIAFAAGVIVTFVALAAVLLALRAAGQGLGWGFQLQSPAVVTALALLFFALALNLSGVFEFGAMLPSAAGWSLRNPHADAFLSGVLAVIIASPCTAPFMGAALGFAITQPPVETLAVFAALGVGMALPFTLLSLFPAWRRVLPRPGNWMVRLKQLLAFPLYATVAWLAWVLGAQLDNDAVMRLLVALVVLALALWSWRTFRGGATRAFAMLAAVALAGAGAVAWPLFRATPGEARTVARDGTWETFSPARVGELTAAGRPVFVDFTAAWCVTCQVNERLVLSKPAVRDAFASRNVALVRADWTRRDPAITTALNALGRSGVPAYVLYRPGKAPLVLAEVLHAGAIEDALATLDRSSRQASN